MAEDETLAAALFGYPEHSIEKIIATFDVERYWHNQQAQRIDFVFTNLTGWASSCGRNRCGSAFVFKRIKRRKLTLANFL